MVLEMEFKTPIPLPQFEVGMALVMRYQDESERTFVVEQIVRFGGRSTTLVLVDAAPTAD